MTLEIIHRVVAVIGGSAAVVAVRRLFVFADFKVKVRTGAVPGGSHTADLLPAGYDLSDSYETLAQVAVYRNGASP